MKLRLNTWQRVTLYQIVGNARGNIIRMRKAMKVLDQLEMSESDWEKAGKRILPDGNAAWTERGLRFDIEINDKEAVQLLKDEVENFENWPFGQFEDILGILDQLGIEDNETPRQEA